MVDWRTIKKIDAHIHIFPDDVHEANPDSEDAWVHAADLRKYCGMMDILGIEKAIIMPFNDPWLMSMEFTIAAVHKNLYDMKQRYPGKFYAFADVDTRNAPAESVDAILEITSDRYEIAARIKRESGFEVYTDAKRLRLALYMADAISVESMGEELWFTLVYKKEHLVK